MIKKMYVRRDNLALTGTMYLQLDDNGHPQNIEVWVSDRDPHENVRKYLRLQKGDSLSIKSVEAIIKDMVGAKTLREVCLELLKDLKNTEGAGE